MDKIGGLIHRFIFISTDFYPWIFSHLASDKSVDFIFISTAPDVLENTYSRALLPMIFVISVFELTKTARSALKVEKQVGSVYLLGVKGVITPSPGREKLMFFCFRKVDF